MLLRTFAVIFGLFFLAIGILGFIPEMTPDDKLIGMFKVNALLNVIHLGSGIIALWTGLFSSFASKLFFQIFGIVYALIAIFGFVHAEQDILGIIANNNQDSWLHALVAIISLYLGFAVKVK